MAIKQGTTNAVTRKVARSKYATDVMYRVWDSYNSAWITVNSRSIWTSKTAVQKIIQSLVDKGRDPSTLELERVFVEVK